MAFRPVPWPWGVSSAPWYMAGSLCYLPLRTYPPTENLLLLSREGDMESQLFSHPTGFLSETKQSPSPFHATLVSFQEKERKEKKTGFVPFHTPHLSHQNPEKKKKTRPAPAAGPRLRQACGVLRHRAQHKGGGLLVEALARARAKHYPRPIRLAQLRGCFLCSLVFCADESE